MSVRNALLALLDPDPKYGYQLRAEFEARTGATWPLNVGQVYTTLARLERDGLVRREGTVGESDTQVLHALTDTGRAEVAGWFETPVPRSNPPRDELAIKLALAVDAPGVDVTDVLQRQRASTIAALQEHTRVRRRRTTSDADLGPDELAWSLVLDALVFAAEAEVRWLDHCEARLSRRARATRRTGPGPATGPDTTATTPGDGTPPAPPLPQEVP